MILRTRTRWVLAGAMLTNGRVHYGVGNYQRVGVLPLALISAFRIVNKSKHKRIIEIVYQDGSLTEEERDQNLPRGLIDETRKYCIQALLRNRIPVDAPPIEQIDERIVQKIRHGNAVNIAGLLMLLNDPTAVFLFTGNE